MEGVGTGFVPGLAGCRLSVDEHCADCGFAFSGDAVELVAESFDVVEGVADHDRVWAQTPENLALDPAPGYFLGFRVSVAFIFGYLQGLFVDEDRNLLVVLVEMLD